MARRTEARRAGERAGTCFLSHSSRDVKQAREVRDLLQGAGMTCWMAPDDIPPGADWPAEIVAAIERSTHLVVLLSAASVRSDHVSREVALASERDVQVVPLRLEDVSPEGTLRYMLQVVHRVDVFPGRIRDHRDDILAAMAPTRPRPSHPPDVAMPPPPGDTHAPVASRAAWTARRSTLSAVAAGAVILGALLVVPGLLPGGGAGTATPSPVPVPTLPASAVGAPPSGPAGAAVARVAWVDATSADAPRIHVVDLDRDGRQSEVATIDGDAPALSPEGDLLTFATGDLDRRRHFVRDLASGLAVDHELSVEGGVAWPSGFVPSAAVDGQRRLAYTGIRGADEESQAVLLLADLAWPAGGSPTIETECPVLPLDGELRAHWHPAWSPDGAELAAGYESADIELAPAACGDATTETTLVYHTPAAPATEPGWFASGLLVMIGSDPCVDTHLALIGAGGPVAEADRAPWMGAQEGVARCHPHAVSHGSASAAVYLERSAGEGGYRVWYARPGADPVFVSGPAALTGGLSDALRPSVALLGS